MVSDVTQSRLVCYHGTWYLSVMTDPLAHPDGPNAWEPNGAAAGAQLGQAIDLGIKVAAGAGAGAAAQRHYQATGNWKEAAIAGGRGFVRWYIYCEILVISLGYLLACVLTTVSIYMAIAGAAPTITSTEDFLAQVPLMMGGPLLTLLAFPYGLGVLWVRFSDRSLFRVNHWRIYKVLAPFAHRVRSLPDIILALSPFILWPLGSFIGGATGQLLVTITG